MIAAYLAIESPLHRLPAGVKLAGLAVASLLILPLTDPLLLLAALAAVLAAYAALGRRAVARLRLLKPLLPLIAILALLQGWTSGWAPALATAARIVLMVLLADLVTLSTRLQDMMAALERLLTPLARLGLDTRRLSLAVALVLRFVPVILASWQGREEAWRARSPRRPSPALIAAFFAGTLKTADHVADALDARGFASRRPADPRG